MKALLLAALALSGAAQAQQAVVVAPQWPAIVAIEFEGNGTTQEKVMLREMIVQPGDPADPALIERSRQYIQDLGLFRRVTATEVPVEGGVKLKISVQEKWYILAYPRFSVTVEGQESTGGELRWANVGGLNHSLRVNALRSDLKLANRGRETSYSASYSAPYVFDSPYRLSLAASHVLSPVEGPVAHDETFDNASVTVARTFADPGGARSQGTTISGGLLWQREDREGAGVPAPYGQATGLTASYGYRSIRFRSFSEEGHSWRVGTAFARKGLASDYNYFAADASYNHFGYVGDTPHQSLNWFLSTGLYSLGPQEINAYSFGGSSVLRAYDANSLEGNFFYLATAEFFRPVFAPWLRVGTILEAGKVFASTRDAHLDSIDASLGLALRVRITMFVNLELEFGYAFPLDGGEGKIFGGRV